MPAIVLDISRTVSRLGKGRQTGIDRVERAYIKHFLLHAEPVFFLARFRKQTVLLDRDGMQHLWALIQNGGPWPQVSRIQKILRTSKFERALRQHSVGWPRLRYAIKRNVPNGFTYINVGHGRFNDRLWPDLKSSGAGRLIVMIHDVIPLDYPEFCRPHTTETFENNLRCLSNHVDTIIYNSEDTAKRAQRWFDKWGRGTIAGHVVLLGTDPLPKTDNAPPKHPYFVCLGTIEPRKNHALLLDVWRDFHENLDDKDIPHLHIIGARGWMNDAVFKRLDSDSFMNKTVFEHNGLADSEVFKILSGAHALLFPSFAEGFGFPLLEAMKLGIPTVCSPLPSLKEISLDTPTYVDSQDIHAWRENIAALSTHPINRVGFSQRNHELFSWSHHFHNINTIVSDK